MIVLQATVKVSQLSAIYGLLILEHSGLGASELVVVVSAVVVPAAVVSASAVVVVVVSTLNMYEIAVVSSSMVVSASFEDIEAVFSSPSVVLVNKVNSDSDDGCPPSVVKGSE